MPNFASQHPADYGWGAWGGAGANRIVQFKYKGFSFPAGIADILVPQATALLDEIVPLIEAGVHDGWNWGFENRANVNSPSQRSLHSYGLALDLNAPANGNGAGRAGSGPYGIPASAASIARKYGWLHGGEWGDPMHFECHNSPAEVLQWNAAHAGGGGTKPSTPPPATGGSSGSTTFPFPADEYYGLKSGPRESHGGFNASEQPMVKRIQKLVGVTQDGNFGPNTEAAVKKWQSANKLAADGKVGPKTFAAMVKAGL